MKPSKNDMPSKIKKIYFELFENMKVEEINKLLNDKNISPQLKKDLEKKKEALVNDNKVNK